MLNLLINKIIQAIVKSDAFANAIINICDQHYTDIDNLNNEIENAINNLELEDRVKQIETSIYE